mmetsp:Transcript_8706/g.18390  ORF Transcript_8706/g.18390 Transcript_8706/m.18390 type:complete len:272 (-) Transcript_8706:103-918(-)|eukprot:CAMPEP_0183305736 /NCGR_PEP_ID=MMETSP0160_2-20130417/10388_1 /TAXON_ID=2839 ORGANISM="Odontella Sinensis, Strain Grunow 1884" /NCGR_SAMPLE_ID=MMETSP0160_2 /ASSEMBLY_ACC=CAM_ASM_000250 /LENGTH=271 /DNA_ID=CAMNT_0025468997 /DNA_START=70 /DNA_END=885 /DNA_ORIENTATION=-
MLVPLLACLSATASGLAIPTSPAQQTRRAITSIRSAIASRPEESTKPTRLYVDYLIPLPPETKDEDIDPWPGGLAQMYPYAEDILKDILRGVVNDPAPTCGSQILSEPDCCGFFVQESISDPKGDVAAILFPGVDQLKDIERISAMVGNERNLLIFNRQFSRPADFGFFNKGKAEDVVFNTFDWGFAFQELACRGEDVKLTFEHPNWYSCAVCDENIDLGRQEIKLLEPQAERPTYEELEKKINIVLPEPLWMRKMGEAQDKGLKFQRGQD